MSRARLVTQSPHPDNYIESLRYFLSLYWSAEPVVVPGMVGVADAIHVSPATVMSKNLRVNQALLLLLLAEHNTWKLCLA